MSLIEEILEDESGTLERAVTVVIPAYNEAAHVAEQVRAVDKVMRESGWVTKILVGVGRGGSADATAEQAAGAGVRVLRRRRNRGYGAALKLGVHSAKYPWVS